MSDRVRKYSARVYCREGKFEFPIDAPSKSAARPIALSLFAGMMNSLAKGPVTVEVESANDRKTPGWRRHEPMIQGINIEDAWKAAQRAN
jgi:hypothetical protein